MKLLYIADDGTQFSSKIECYAYESKNDLNVLFLNENAVKYVLDNPDCTVKELLAYLKPCEYDIPWDEIEEVFRYVAMDSNGSWYKYSVRPFIDSDPIQWFAFDYFEYCDVINFTHYNWKKSLFERPKKA